MAPSGLWPGTRRLKLKEYHSEQSNLEVETMSSQGRIFQGRFHTLFVSALILFIAMVTASCGEGGGAAGTPSSTPSQPISAVDTIILKADPGSVCETLLTGEIYTRTPTNL